MTNETNLDYLFKLMAPAPDRGAGSSTSSSGRRPAFDDHLASASTSASGLSSDASVRPGSADSGLAQSVGRTSATRSDGEFATSEKVSGRPAENPTEQIVSGAEDESRGDAASSEDEGVVDDDDTAEIAELAAQTPQEQRALAKDQLADAATTATKSPSPSGGDAEQNASNPLADELGNTKLTVEELATNAEIDAAQSQSSDASAPHGGPDLENASNSAFAAANDGQQQHQSIDNRSGVSANAGTNTEPKVAKATVTSRRGTSRNNESAGERSALDAADRADANASQNASSATPVANVTSAQLATAAAREVGEEGTRAAKPIGYKAEGIQLSARTQRWGVAGSRRAHAANAPELPRIDATRFVGRVAKAVQTAQDRGGLVQLRLSPPELGSLRLELAMQNGVMTASVETETPAARQVLLDHLPALRERLAEQNIRIERFDVDVRQENSGGQSDPGGSQQEQRKNQPQVPNSAHSGRAATPHAPSVDAPHVLTRLTNSELNMLA
jgi:flagellar hook-length control protein FliK